MSMMVSFVLSFFPRDVLDEILNLIESVSEDFPSYSSTIYWLPKLHKQPYKSQFIASSSSCTTTELSKLLTSCLTSIKTHVIKYCEKVYERSGKNLFWSIQNSCEVINKLK